MHQLLGRLLANYQGDVSPSGVRIAPDFRDNLIIDRYDPVFADMRGSKLRHLHSANSEDAVTWNVFRSLRQITPEAWLPCLWQRAFPSNPCPSDYKTAIRLWRSVAPPPGLLAGGDEGPSEIDVVIEAPTWVWFIEAKYTSDISLRTTTRPERDQILRNIDVGSYYAGVRPFFFSLLVASEEHSREGAKRMREYADLSLPKLKLCAHRTDGLQNLSAISQITWATLGAVFDEASKQTSREDERTYALRAGEWLRHKGLLLDKNGSKADMPNESLATACTF